MVRFFLLTVVVGLAPTGVFGQSVRTARPVFHQSNRVMPASMFDEDFFKEKNGANGDKNGNGKNGNSKEEEPPKHIRDNSFLLQEAVNQEAGVVQHISTLGHAWTSSRQGRSRELGFGYTMELPLGSQEHQFSFLLPFTNQITHPVGGPVTQQGGIADMEVNYRYQLLADDDFLWCAPNFGLIFPTGDERFGTGSGQLGYSFVLPISHYGDEWDFHFNAGIAYVPDVSLPLEGGLFSPRHGLKGYRLGASAFWKPSHDLHFFVESLALWEDEINDGGSRESITQVVVNPGFRYALCQLDEVEWVVGVSVPVGLTRDTPDIGVLGYMSVEHNFRKKKNGRE